MIAGDPTPITNDPTPQATRPLDRTPQTNDRPYQHRHIRCLPLPHVIVVHPPPDAHSPPTSSYGSSTQPPFAYWSAMCRTPCSCHRCRCRLPQRVPPAPACATCLSMHCLPQHEPPASVCTLCLHPCLHKRPPCNW
jgi:hypothetical protein